MVNLLISPKLAEYIPTISNPELFRDLSKIFNQLKPVQQNTNAVNPQEAYIVRANSNGASAMNRSQEINSTTSSANTTRLKHLEIVVKDGKIKGDQLEELKLRLTEALAKKEQLNTLMKKMHKSGENDR